MANYSSGELNDALDEIEDIPGVSRGRLGLDILGFYWPLADKKSMHGFVINSTSDSLIDDDSDDRFSIHQHTYSYSYHQFFGANIGDQWFWRGDIGIARFVIDINSSSLNFTEDSDLGIGALVGGGYGFAIGQETRMLLGGYLSHREADDASATNFSVLLGFLF